MDVGNEALAVADQHLLNLRQMQEEALASLYAGTSVAGFALVLLGLQFGARYRSRRNAHRGPARTPH